MNTIYLSVTLFSLSRVGRRHNSLLVEIMAHAFLKHTLWCLIDVPPIINFSFFFHPGHSYPAIEFLKYNPPKTKI